jgi:rhodanese-related sulfurtransferase
MKSILAAVVCLVLTAAASAAPPKIVDITQGELKAAIASKTATILDVNGSDSYRRGHIPGAIDFLAHRKDIAALLPADKNALIVAYCGDIHCTAYREAAYAAVDLGYTNVRHFAPGIKGWKDSGETTESAGD